MSEKGPVGLPGAVVWRIARRRHALDRLGTGARQDGGRWNRVGTGIIYTGCTIAITALERFVHLAGVVPRPVRFPPGLDDEAPGSAKRHDGHHRVGPQLRLVIGVEPHAVLPAPVAVDEDVIEQHAGLRAHACEETLRRRRERPRLERLPRIPVAELPGPGDQAGLEDAPPEEHDLPLLPRQLVAERPQCLVGLRGQQPAGVVVEPGA